MLDKAYKVFIPKYSFSLKGDKAIKELSDESLSIVVVASSAQDALFQALRDLSGKDLQAAGYKLEDIKVVEEISGQEVKVYIKGVKP